MVVGMPGTGIGGLYYLIMIALMPLRELWLLTRGRSSLARWRFIAVQWAMVAGILGSLWLTMVGVRLGLHALGIDASQTLAVFRPGASTAQVADETNAFFAKAAWASMLSLGGCVLVVHALRLTVCRRRTSLPKPTHTGSIDP